MSFALLPLIWAAELDGTDKLVLLRLADHATDDGKSIYPAIPNVAKSCGLSVRTTQESMKRLREAGVLVETRKANTDGKKTAEYRIDVQRLNAVTLRDYPGRIRTGADFAHAQIERVPPQNSTFTPAESADKPLLTLNEPLRGSKAYVWQGKVARLNAKDYQEWKSRYHAIPDFDADLAGLDSWWDALHPEGNAKRKEWFYAISSSLAKSHQKWTAEIKNPTRRPDDRASGGGVAAEIDAQYRTWGVI